MRKHTAAEMGKSGQIQGTMPKRDKWASQENCDFFPGYVVKNRDCPGRMVTLVSECLLSTYAVE